VVNSWCDAWWNVVFGGAYFPDERYANFLRFIFVDALAAPHGAVLL
jgi:hypothetical protein